MYALSWSSDELGTRDIDEFEAEAEAEAMLY